MWLDTLHGVLNTTFRNFFPESMGDHVLVEVACQPQGNCNADVRSFESPCGWFIRLIHP